MFLIDEAKNCEPSKRLIYILNIDHKLIVIWLDHKEVFEVLQLCVIYDN